jgi:hypothetical protein
MNKLMLSCLVVGLVLKAQAQQPLFSYSVEGDLSIALTVTYTDDDSWTETDTSWSVKTKSAKITNATVIKSIAEQAALVSISKAAKLMFQDNDGDITFIIRDPMGLGEDVDVSEYFEVTWADLYAFSEKGQADNEGRLKSASGSGQDLADIVINLASPITLRGLSKYTWKGYEPKDDVNAGVYWCENDSITCIGSDEATGGVVSGTVTTKEKLVKAKVVE